MSDLPYVLLVLAAPFLVASTFGGLAGVVAGFLHLPQVLVPACIAAMAAGLLTWAWFWLFFFAPSEGLDGLAVMLLTFAVIALAPFPTAASALTWPLGQRLRARLARSA